MNVFNKRTALIVGLGILATGYLIKSGKAAVKAGKAPEDTIAGKIGLI